MKFKATTAPDLSSQLVDANLEIFGLAPADELELYTTRVVGTVVYSYFRKNIDDIPVFGADLIVKTTRPLRIDQQIYEDQWGDPVPENQIMFQSSDKVRPTEQRSDWEVVSVTNHAYLVKAPEQTTPVISSSSAAAGLGPSAARVETGNPGIVYYVGRADVRAPELAYLFSSHDGSERVLVSAISGNVLYDDVRRGSAGIASHGIVDREKFSFRSEPSQASASTGCSQIASDIRIYPSNPDNGPLELRYANVCFDTNPILKGHFADVDVVGRTRLSGDFTGILPGDPGWSEISTFWHMSQASWFFHEQGFIDDVSTFDSDIDLIEGQINSNVDGNMGSFNGLVSPAVISLSESMGTGSPYFPGYNEAAIVAHEVGHAMHFKFTSVPTCADRTAEKCAISEAIADYLGIKYRNFSEGQISAPWLDPIMGVYAVETPSDPNVATLPRDLTHTGPHYSLFGVDTAIWSGNASEQTVYDASMILSTALMDFDEIDGWNTSHNYVIAAFRGLPGPPSFLDVRDELIDATGVSVVAYNPIYTTASPTYVSCTASCSSAANLSMRGRGIFDDSNPNFKQGTGSPVRESAGNIELTRPQRVFPNPASDQVIVRMNALGNKDQEVSFRVFDIMGQDVTRLVRWSSGSGGYILDTSDLASGTYIIVTQAGGSGGSSLVQILR